MRLDLDHLPHDTALLHQLVRDLAARVEQRDGEIEKLRLIVRQLQRGQFGPKSERLDPDQLQLGLEDLDADIAHPETTMIERVLEPLIAGVTADDDAVLPLLLDRV